MTEQTSLLQLDSKDMSVFIGIDPGKQGYIAVVDRNGNLLSTHPMPVIKVTKGKNEYDEDGFIRLLTGLRDNYRIELVMIEQQQAMPAYLPVKKMQNGLMLVRVLQGGTSTFTTGDGYGLCRGIVAGLGLPRQKVSVRKWHARFLTGLTGESKAKALIAAQGLFPGWPFKKSKDGEFDAALLAEYGRREWFGAA